MELTEAIKNRKSTRMFSNKKISKQIIETICHYAYKIPSAGNLKPIELYIAEFDQLYLYNYLCRF